MTIPAIPRGERLPLRLVPPLARRPRPGERRERGRTRVPDAAPPLDWAGTVRIRRSVLEVLATVAPAFVPPVAAAGAWAAADGSPLAMMGVGCGVGLLVAAYDRRRTRENRWSTTARPPAGARRRTDAERLQAMAETASADGVVHRG